MTIYYRGKDVLYDDGIASPRWVYHPAAGGKLVDEPEAQRLLAEGWFDNPSCATPEPEPEDPAEGDDESPKPAKGKAPKAK